MLVTQAKYVAPDISGVSKSRVKQLHMVLLLIILIIIKYLLHGGIDCHLVRDSDTMLTDLDISCRTVLAAIW